MLVNSWARSTFDISTAPGVTSPAPDTPGASTVAAPEFWDAWNLFPDIRWRPLSFGNFARLIVATTAETPAVTVITSPFWPTLAESTVGGTVIFVSAPPEVRPTR